MSSNSDSGGEVLLFLLGLIFVVIALLSYALGLALLAGAVVGIGILSNMAIRYIPNQLDWREIDEYWIWGVIGGLVLVPIIVVVIGLTLFVSVNALKSNFFAFVVLFLPVYILWIGGYMWAWVDPRFEKGAADVLMAKTLALTLTQMDMWWTNVKLRLKLFALDLGL